MHNRKRNLTFSLIIIPAIVVIFLSLYKFYSVSSKQSNMNDYKQDGPDAQRIASVIPYYKFHGVDRFYDISGILANPDIFQLTIDIFVARYASLDIDVIAGVDARGFILGPPIALALKKPFIMIRKKGKLPNAVSGSQYYKEYEGDNAHGGDELCIPRTSISPGAKVMVIDDLVATGGTLIAACDLLSSVGFNVRSTINLIY